MQHKLEQIGKRFRIPGAFLKGASHGSGNINDTYRVSYGWGKEGTDFIFQKMNGAVFKKPEEVMDNIRRVTGHLQGRGGGCVGLRLVPSVDGKPFALDGAGHVWRVFYFIRGAHVLETVENQGQAFAAAAAFAGFQKGLSDLPGRSLHETIKDFHNTEKRFEELLRVAGKDTAGRVVRCREEIAFAVTRKNLAHVISGPMKRGGIPCRVCHNDTKLSNLLFDRDTGKVLCVIDLDTVMPGTVLHDFGDLVRTATNAVGEEERDLSRVYFRPEIFKALAAGYLSEAAGFLTEREAGLLALAGQVITFELAVRFLTDYLTGDRYFKTVRPGQNLDRARNQFRLLRSMEEHEKEMHAVVSRLWRACSGH